MGIFGKKSIKSAQSNEVSNDWDLLCNAINAVFKVGQNNNSPGLFDTAVQSIASLSNAAVVLVGKHNANESSIETLAYFENGELNDNFTYSLANTPCAKIIGTGPCTMVSGVQKKYPDNLFFIEHKIEAYIGVPLYYANSKPMGLLVAMFHQPIANVEGLEMVLKVYSIKLSGEIEYLDNNRVVEMQTKELNLLLDQLKSKNKALDLTVKELDEARAFAEESNQLKTAFLANLSHEVRTPMNVMLGFSELLKSDMLLHEERIEYINIINQNGFQLLKIMDNLIEVSKFQSKRMVNAPKPFHVNELVDAMLDKYKDYIELVQKPIELKASKALSDGDDLVTTDRECIFKILDQLLDNAVKFTPSGKIEFGYEQQGGNLFFTVTDTGVGVPEGMEEKIFDMFRQVDIKASREFGGNGLGLAIARKYSELLNGRIWVENPENYGSMFCLEIPLAR